MTLIYNQPSDDSTSFTACFYFGLAPIEFEPDDDETDFDSWPDGLPNFDECEGVPWDPAQELADMIEYAQDQARGIYQNRLSPACQDIADALLAYDVRARPTCDYDRMMRSKAKAIIEGRAPWPKRMRHWRSYTETAHFGDAPWQRPKNLTPPQRAAARQKAAQDANAPTLWAALKEYYQ